MRTISKEQLKTEIIRRKKIAFSKGTCEDSAQTISRLLGCLMKSWITPEGKIWTLRAYWLKYNREEYKNILRAITLNKRYGLSTFDQQTNNFEGLNLNHWHIEDFKQDKSQRFDGRNSELIDFYKEAYQKEIA